MKAAVLYFTTSGNTEQLAERIFEIVKEKADVSLSAFEDASEDLWKDAEWIALGSPAQGTEELDESFFLPFYQEHGKELKEKKLFLFGCYGWGGGRYMEDFASVCEKDGLKIAGIYTQLEGGDEESEAALRRALAASF